MGCYYDACMEAFKQETGIRDITGAHGEALNGLSDAAFELIKIIQLEKSGIRSGDGCWGPSDVFGTVVEDLLGAVAVESLARESMRSVEPNSPKTVQGRPLTETHFGVCPKTGNNDGYLNDEKKHWFYCEAGKTKWCAGSNLFSTWHDETPAKWAENRKFLADFEEVEPDLPISLAEPETAPGVLLAMSLGDMAADAPLPRPRRRPWAESAQAA